MSKLAVVLDENGNVYERPIPTIFSNEGSTTEEGGLLTSYQYYSLTDFIPLLLSTTFFLVLIVANIIIIREILHRKLHVQKQCKCHKGKCRYSQSIKLSWMFIAMICVVIFSCLVFLYRIFLPLSPSTLFTLTIWPLLIGAILASISKRIAWSVLLFTIAIAEFVIMTTAVFVVIQ